MPGNIYIVFRHLYKFISLTLLIGSVFNVMFIIHINLTDRPLAQLISEYDIGAGGLRFEYQVGQIGTVLSTARHRCDVFSELRCPGARLRRWVLPLVTRFGVIPRVH